MDPGLIHPAQLVDHVDLRTRAPVAWDSLSLRVPCDTSASGPGQLVHHAGPRILARGTRDIWSTPRARGPEREVRVKTP